MHPHRTATCPDRETLKKFSAGELAGEEEFQRVAAHVEEEECAACQAVLAELANESEGLVRDIRRDVRQPDEPHGPEDGDVTARCVPCPFCRTAVELPEPEATEIVCHSCGSSFSLAMLSAVEGDASSGGRMLGRFEIVRELGSGGFGAVYLARDPKLDRQVAVKIPRRDVVARGKDQSRFLREALSVAGLSHPGIVPIHDVGEADGVPYLVCEFVQGATLSDHLKSRRPAFREAAQLAACVAEALQASHDQGVVHRDVKPSNIMIGEDGAPRLMDFGLAKRDAAEITVTLEGDILGTPAYMSPEQAEGEASRVDGRSDVYSLGVVLYQLLTGELPFRGDVREVIRQATHEEPPAPRTLNSRIPHDLQTICLKAMAKEPPRRYETAAALAADLRRWLAGEPIVARPVGRLQRAWLWCRRNPALAAAATTASLLVILLLTTVTIAYFREAALAKNEREQRRVAEQELLRSKMIVSYEQWRRGDLTSVQQTLYELATGDSMPGRGDLHRFGWRYLWRLVNTPGRRTYSPPIRPDWSDQPMRAIPIPGSRSMAVYYFDGAVRLLDERFSPRTLTGGVASFDADKLRDLFTVARKSMLASSRDGRWLAWARHDGAVAVWDLQSGKLWRELKPEPGAYWATGLAFSPSGETLATAHFGDGVVRLWARASGEQTAKLSAFKGGSTNYQSSLAWSPDGKFLAINGEDLRLWDVAARRFLEPLQTGTRAGPVAFSPDGRTLAVIMADRVDLWDVESRTIRGRLFGHHQDVISLDFSRDGARLATAGWDKTVRIWDAESGRPLRVLRGHPYQLFDVKFFTDGQLLSAGQFRVVVWDLHQGQSVETFEVPAGPVNSLAFAGDSHVLAAAAGGCGSATGVPPPTCASWTSTRGRRESCTRHPTEASNRRCWRWRRRRTASLCLPATRRALSIALICPAARRPTSPDMARNSFRTWPVRPTAGFSPRR